jgi:hypothetical protein
MGRPKRTSKILEKAGIRMAALTSIDTNLDLGNGLTLGSYTAIVADTRNKLDKYNSLLSQVDEANNFVDEAEKALADMSDRMLAGVASKYGRDSHEYEMAGGVRKSDRKQPARKPKVPAKA